jgi:hypothetical protein
VVVLKTVRREVVVAMFAIEHEDCGRNNCFPHAKPGRLAAPLCPGQHLQTPFTTFLPFKNSWHFTDFVLGENASLCSRNKAFVTLFECKPKLGYPHQTFKRVGSRRWSMTSPIDSQGYGKPLVLSRSCKQYEDSDIESRGHGGG